MYVSMVKTIYYKPTVNIVLNNENVKAFPLRLETRCWCPAPTSIQHSTKSSSQSN
jgi:hypothetical protein